MISSAFVQYPQDSRAVAEHYLVRPSKSGSQSQEKTRDDARLHGEQTGSLKWSLLFLLHTECTFEIRIHKHTGTETLKLAASSEWDMIGKKDGILQLDPRFCYANQPMPSPGLSAMHQTTALRPCHSYCLSWNCTFWGTMNWEGAFLTAKSWLVLVTASHWVTLGKDFWFFF